MLIAASRPPAFCELVVAKYATQSAYWSGRILESEASRSCPSTEPASPTIPTSTSRDRPISMGSRSTCMSLASAAKRGAFPYPRT